MGLEKVNIDPESARLLVDENQKRFIEAQRRGTVDALIHMVTDETETPMEEKLAKANIPRRYKNACFESLTKDGCPDRVRPIAVEAYRYAQHLREHIEKGEGLLFSGAAGLMKTTLACCIARKAVEQHVSVYFISMPELLDTLVAMSRNKDPTELHLFEERIKNVSLLILDDFGAEYPSGWVLNKVDAIITNRYNNMKPVIITTNLIEGEMKEHYVERVFDRLRSANKLLSVAGESLRPKAGGGNRT